MGGRTWKRGCVQVYTGSGKGKTTAALGLALRAAGAGLHVLFAQFVKGKDYSEVKAVERLSDRITLRQFGTGRFVHGSPSPEEIEAARVGLEEVCRQLSGGHWDVVILDEANVAADLELFSVDDLLRCIHLKPEHVEVVITGRNADPRVLERADLVTEMREVKHYFADGVQAREGIES